MARLAFGQAADGDQLRELERRIHAREDEGFSREQRQMIRRRDDGRKRVFIREPRGGELRRQTPRAFEQQLRRLNLPRHLFRQPRARIETPSSISPEQQRAQHFQRQPRAQARQLFSLDETGPNERNARFRFRRRVGSRGQLLCGQQTPTIESLGQTVRAQVRARMDERARPRIDHSLHTLARQAQRT